MSDNEKIKDRLLKLLELSRRGVGGERESAESMLAAMLKKHGMTMADLQSDDSQTIDTVFTFVTDMEKRLLYQIAYQVVNGDFDAFKIGKGKRKLRLTRSHAAEVRVRYSVLVRALRDELKVFYSAFIMRNNIYPDSARKDKSEFTPEQLEQMEKVARMASGMDRVNIHKQITGAK